MTFSRISVSWPFVFVLFILVLFFPLADLLPILFAALIHELGHCSAVLACGGRLDKIELGLAGAELYYRGERLSYGRDALIAAAGPFANMLAVWLSHEFFRPQWAYFSGLNLLYCVFNLLPALPLDGGRILYALAAVWAGSENAERLLGTVTPVILSLLAAAGAAAVFWLGGNPSLLIAASAIFLALWQKNALQGRRKKL